MRPVSEREGGAKVSQSQLKVKSRSKKSEKSRRAESLWAPWAWTSNEGLVSNTERLTVVLRCTTPKAPQVEALAEGPEVRAGPSALQRELSSYRALSSTSLVGPGVSETLALK